MSEVRKSKLRPKDGKLLAWGSRYRHHPLGHEYILMCETKTSLAEVLRTGTLPAEFDAKKFLRVKICEP